jgi:arrestin-related trafficking adapter 3/6
LYSSIHTNLDVRLGQYEDDHTDDDDDDDIQRATSRGRVNVANPRTPGGRIARSMDIDRNFMFAQASLMDQRSSGETSIQTI